jgi:hypothetical protein
VVAPLLTALLCAVRVSAVDWFRPWPSDALDAVASTFLEEVEMEKHNRQSTVEMCKIFHESIRDMSIKFRVVRALLFAPPLVPHHPWSRHHPGP